MTDDQAERVEQVDQPNSGRIPIKLLIQVGDSPVSSTLAEFETQATVNLLEDDDPRLDRFGAKVVYDVDPLAIATRLEAAAKELRRSWRENPDNPAPAATLFPAGWRTECHENVDLEEVVHAHVEVKLPKKPNGIEAGFAGIHLAPGERVRIRRTVVLELTGAPAQ